jgi:hypothetical protein
MNAIWLASPPTYNMAATLKWIAGDIESMIPSWSFSSTVQKAPEIGDAAPQSALQLPEQQPTVLLFTRVSMEQDCQDIAYFTMIAYGLSFLRKRWLSFELLNLRHLLIFHNAIEIKRLIALAKEPSNSEIRFIIITHSVPTYELHKFVTEELEQKLPQNVTLFGDAERRVYAAWGIGELSLLEIINKDIMAQVGQLKKEGIANRLTRGTRWARSEISSII